MLSMTLVKGELPRRSSPPYSTMGEERRRFGDRGAAPWEDPFSCLLGRPVEPSAGHFLLKMGARHQELYQQEASGTQGSCTLCPGQGQVHRDSGWRTSSCLSPCPSGACWGSTSWAAPHCHFACGANCA